MPDFLHNQYIKKLFTKKINLLTAILFILILVLLFITSSFIYEKTSIKSRAQDKDNVPASTVIKPTPTGCACCDKCTSFSCKQCRQDITINNITFHVDNEVILDPLKQRMFPALDEDYENQKEKILYFTTAGVSYLQRNNRYEEWPSIIAVGTSDLQPYFGKQTVWIDCGYYYENYKKDGLEMVAWARARTNKGNETCIKSQPVKVKPDIKDDNIINQVDFASSWGRSWTKCSEFDPPVPFSDKQLPEINSNDSTSP